MSFVWKEAGRKTYLHPYISLFLFRSLTDIEKGANKFSCFVKNNNKLCAIAPFVPWASFTVLLVSIGSLVPSVSLIVLLVSIGSLVPLMYFSMLLVTIGSLVPLVYFIVLLVAVLLFLEEDSNSGNPLESGRGMDKSH